MGHEGIRSWSTWGQHRQSLDSITRQILHSSKKYIDDHPHDVNQALPWSSAHTVLPSISSPEFPLPSISTASQQSSLPSITTSLPSNHRLWAFLLPSNCIRSNFASRLQCFRVLLQLRLLPEKATTLVLINGSKHDDVWYPIHPRIRTEKQQVMSNMPPRSCATQDSCVPGHHCYHECNG